ncbi:MAG: hypothetical protein ACD_58C00317G0017 [uncultured bacterium]|nr:MAG: hypothetical protein ACD_58C00317G0017 [uncultured bacterium]
MFEKKDAQAEEIKQLVIERLKTISSDKKISIGGDGDFTVSELIDSVKKNNKIGKKIIEVQMDFLKTLKTGTLLDE